MLGLSDKEIEAIQKGTWELPCLSMELRRLDGKYVFSGSGIIQQNEHHQLAFTLLDAQNVGGLKTVFEDLNKPNLSAGQIIPKGHYYELHAVDNSENTWRSVSTLNVNPAYGPSSGVVVRGTIRELWRINDHTDIALQMAKDKNEPVTPFFKHAFWDYYCFEKVGQFPCNAGVETSLRVAGREVRSSSSISVSHAESDVFIFELQADNGVVQFLVQGKNDRSYPDNIEFRFIEALQFVLGCPFDWEVMVICHGNIEELGIRPVPIGQPRVRMLPPLAFTVHQYYAEFWELYQKYLTYILPFQEIGWHPISRRIFSLQHGMSALWPIRMLTAGVEVEGLLNEHYTKRVSGSSAIINAVDRLLSLLEDIFTKQPGAIDAESNHRIKSSLGHLKGSRPLNKLKKLINEGIVRQADVDAWEFVRNKSAHAMAAETALSQENSQRLDQVLVLFYHLLFNLIGYKGKFTDYGTLGFPVKDYPLK